MTTTAEILNDLRMLARKSSPLAYGQEKTLGAAFLVSLYENSTRPHRFWGDSSTISSGEASGTGAFYRIFLASQGALQNNPSLESETISEYAKWLIIEHACGNSILPSEHESLRDFVLARKAQ